VVSHVRFEDGVSKGYPHRKGAAGSEWFLTLGSKTVVRRDTRAARARLGLNVIVRWVRRRLCGSSGANVEGHRLSLAFGEVTEDALDVADAEEVG